jgi:hypothetical protein
MINYSVTVRLDGLPKMVNASFKNNWRALWAEKKKWKELVARSFLPHQPAEPLQKAKVTIIRYSSRCPDFDGMVSGAKALLDGLKLARIIIDDNMNVIGQPNFKWEKAPPKKGAIEITVESI